MLKINNAEYQNEKNHQLLGIYIDESLSWTFHFSKIFTNLVATINLLKRISYYLTYDMKKLFYNSYIMSIIDYGCLTWSQTNKRCMTRILHIQKRAARIILRKKIKTPSNLRFKEIAMQV